MVELVESRLSTPLLSLWSEIQSNLLSSPKDPEFIELTNQRARNLLAHQESREKRLRSLAV